MKPGTLLCDDQFKFSDGSERKKILVVLNDGAVGYYIIIKTTSNQKFKGVKFGCQSRDRYPNFFLPQASSCLHKDSWLMLNEFFSFELGEFCEKILSKKIVQIGVLRDDIFPLLLDCAIHCDDITLVHRRALEDLVKSI